MKSLIHKPGKSIFEYVNMEVLRGVFKLNLFSNFKKFVRNYFSDDRLTALMDFPVLFLGSAPENTPALYSLMNYAGLLLGTWYPENGMYRIIESMEELAIELGVKIETNAEVLKINTENKLVKSIIVNNETHEFDAIIAAGDYHHMETLLPQQHRNYSEKYWDTRVLAPSSLLFFLGIDKKIPSLDHHTLFFDESLDDHSSEIYSNPKWPEKPLFILIPIAAGLKDSEEIREYYFNIIIKRLENQIQDTISTNIIYKKSYCINDFISDYHSYKGNAYGLANTLTQTAILKPKLNNKKLKNLVYAGQLTVPGPGMPPALISGKLAAEEIINYLSNV